MFLFAIAIEPQLACLIMPQYSYIPEEGRSRKPYVSSEDSCPWTAVREGSWRFIINTLTQWVSLYDPKMGRQVTCPTAQDNAQFLYIKCCVAEGLMW